MKHKIDWSAVVAIVLFALIVAAGCSMNRPYKHVSEAEKWEKFRKCSKNEGDLGCEECYQKIFGRPSEGYYFSGYSSEK